jgi:hypothetical protein
MSRYRFPLVLEDGEPADPPAFVTVPPEWHPGDEFLAGERVRRFRIGAIDPTMDPDEAEKAFHAVRVVEPVHV